MKRMLLCKEGDFIMSEKCVTADANFQEVVPTALGSRKITSKFFSVSSGTRIVPGNVVELEIQMRFDELKWIKVGGMDHSSMHAPTSQHRHR